MLLLFIKESWGRKGKKKKKKVLPPPPTPTPFAFDSLGLWACRLSTFGALSWDMCLATPLSPPGPHHSFPSPKESAVHRTVMNLVQINSLNSNNDIIVIIVVIINNNDDNDGNTKIWSFFLFLLSNKMCTKKMVPMMYRMRQDDEEPLLR